MKRLLILIALFVLIPFNVYGTGANTPVSNDYPSIGDCYAFQDESVFTNSSGYFGNCIRAKCVTGHTWDTYRIANSGVYCNNGNTNPYSQIVNNGCSQYVGSCSPIGDMHYCSMVTYYDCGKNANGSAYIVPTTTKKPTTTRKPTTTTTTTTTTVKAELDSNNYLKSLALSEGEITFSKEILEYEIAVKESVTYIEVEAFAESPKATVEVYGNETISDEIPISITVTAEDGSTRVYLVKIKYLPKGNISTLISNIEIEGYDLKFNPNIYNYTLKINKKDTELKFKEIELEDDEAYYEIFGNKDLKNKSIVTINVSADDEEAVSSTYTIKIKKSSRVWIFILIGLIVIIIAVLAFRLLRGLIPTKKDRGYDYE